MLLEQNDEWRLQLYSLVETAKANGQEPYAWLPLATSVEDYEALLPLNCTPQLHS